METPTRRIRSRTGSVLLAGMAALVVLVALGGWWTLPVWWGGNPTDMRQQASRALAREDLVALAHLDVRRAVALEQRLPGEPDPGALPDGSGFWGSLVRAGFSWRTDLDDALAGVYTGTDRLNYTLVLLGRFDTEAVQRQLAQHFQMEGPQVESSASGALLQFRWFDEDRCMPGELTAIHLQPDRLVIAPAEIIEPMVQRLDSGAPEELALDDWNTQTKRRLASLAILRPGRMGETLNGLPGMMLTQAGDASAPARAIILGVNPKLLPPGAGVEATLLSNQPDFVAKTYANAQSTLDQMRESATAEFPELADLFDRVTIDREQDRVSAEIRFDSQIGQEFKTLLTAVASRAFGTGPGGLNDPTQEQLAENPTRFGPASQADLKPFDSFGDDDTPLWTGGPFGIHIGKLALSEAGQVSIQLKAEGRGLPNLASRAEPASLRLTDVVDAQGRSLLKPGCRPDKPLQPSTLGQVWTSYTIVDGESVEVPTLSGEKTVNLAAGVSPDQVAGIQGILSYQLPTEVTRFLIDAPLAGIVVEEAGLRMRFSRSEEGNLSYRVSGDTSRLLAVRGLNAQGQVLAESGSAWGDAWFDSGKTVDISLQGIPAQAEVLVATGVTPVDYPFTLASAYPKMAAFSAGSTPAPRIVTTDQFNAAVTNAPPAVSYPFGEPQYEVPAGPGLLTLDQLGFSEFWGLQGRMKLYVSDRIPIAHHLAGAVVTFDNAELADGRKVPLNHSVTVALKPEGGYWMNDTYVPDPERPWYHSDTQLRIKEYAAGKPIAITGRVDYLAPLSIVTETLAAQPGSHWSDGRLKVEVDEWQTNEIRLALEGNSDRLLGIVALDAKGRPVTTQASLDQWFGKPMLRLQPTDRPYNLQLQLAGQLNRRSFPFRLDIED